MNLRKYVSLIIVAIGLTVGVSNAQVQKKISDQDLKDLLARIDTDTDRFAKTADKAMDKSGFDGTSREDELNKHLKNFQKATEALKVSTPLPSHAARGLPEAVSQKLISAPAEINVLFGVNRSGLVKLLVCVSQPF